MNVYAYCSGSIDSSGDVLEKVLDNNFGLRYLVGSDGHSPQQDHPNSVVVDTDDLRTYVARPEVQGSIDVVELFGGESVGV